MKKSIKSIALALLSVGMLAGCTPAASAGGSWSKEEKALMQEHLNGEVLPYVSGIKDFQLAYEPSSDMIMGAGAETTLAKVQKYASAFTEKDGWKETTPGRAPECFYSFEKEVTTAADSGLVEVQFATINEKGEMVEGGFFALFAMFSSANDWDREAKELMKETLYGVVLPFPGMTDLYTDAEDGAFYAIGDTTNTAFIAAYAAKYEAENSGWVNVTPAGAPEYYYAFEKEVSTEAGKRHIQALFATVDEEGSLAENGMFYLQASDPYLYEFPTEYFQGITLEYFDCDTPIPAFPADYYELSSNGTAVYCYTASETEDAGYTAILRDAGWIIEEDRDADGYLVACEPTRAFAVAYLYDATYGSLDIYLSYAPAVKYDYWPADEISAIFEVAEEVEYPVPAFEGEGLKFSAEEYLFFGILPVGVDVTVYGASSDQIDAYLGTTLPNAGWEVIYDAETAQGSATKTFEDLNGVATISLQLYEGNFIITLNYGLEPIPGTYWPADEISEAFKTAGQPEFEVPAPEGADLKFTFTDNQDSGKGKVKVSGITQEELEAYLAALETAGWEGEEDYWGDIDYYKHFEELGFTAHIYVEKYYMDSGYINITIYYVGDKDPVPYWPVDEVKAMLGDDITDVLPEFVFEGATFKVYDDAYGKDVVCFVGEENQDAAIEAYGAILLQAGFTYDEDNAQYVSPNEQFYVSVSKGTDGAVDVMVTIPRNINSEIEAIMAQRGVTGFTCPDFSSFAYDDSNTGVKSNKYYQLALVGDVVNDVLALLEQSGFSVPAEPTDYGYECFSADGQVEMDVNYYSSYELTVIYVYATADLG